jgi:hypothetical protein
MAEEYAHSHGRKVEEVMTANVITVSPESSLQDVVRTMERQGVKRVPVVSDGKVVGIVSRANLVQALANFPDDTPESRADDELELSLFCLNSASACLAHFGPRNSPSILRRHVLRILQILLLFQPRLMGLHFVAQTVHVVLKLSSHRLESVTNRHIHVLVRALDFQMFVRHQLLLV